MAILLRLIYITLLLLYPFGIFFGLKHFEPRFLSLLLLLIALLQFLPNKSMALPKRQKYAIAILALTLLILTQIFNQPLFIKLYPVFINLIFFTFFFITLFYPPSMIEIFARMQDKNLPQKAIPYTRNVTKIWCAFFILNCTISLYTTFGCSLETWTLYNGFISYILIGTLFIGEYLFRIWWRKNGE